MARLKVISLYLGSQLERCIMGRRQEQYCRNFRVDRRLMVILMRTEQAVDMYEDGVVDFREEQEMKVKDV